MNSLSSIHSQFLCEIVIQTKCMEKKNCSKSIQKLWKYVKLKIPVSIIYIESVINA